MSRPDPKLIQPRFKEALSAWVKDAQLPGGFLTAVLHNDLRGAFERADDSALDNLPHIVSYLYNEVPARCWGSPEKVLQWPGMDLRPLAMRGHR